MRLKIWSSEDILDDEARAEEEKQMKVIYDDDDYEMTDRDWADCVYEWLNDERTNLNKDVDGVIIAFANLGLWDGHHIATRAFGINIKNILYSCYNAEWYGEDGDIYGTEHHHDGTNHILYRVARDQEEADEITAKICSGEIDIDGFRQQTASLYPYIARVYGWPEEKKAA